MYCIIVFKFQVLTLFSNQSIFSRKWQSLKLTIKKLNQNKYGRLVFNFSFDCFFTVDFVGDYLACLVIVLK